MHTVQGSDYFPPSTAVSPCLAFTKRRSTHQANTRARIFPGGATNHVRRWLVRRERRKYGFRGGGGSLEPGIRRKVRRGDSLRIATGRVSRCGSGTREVKSDPPVKRDTKHERVRCVASLECGCSAGEGRERTPSRGMFLRGRRRRTRQGG